MTKIQLPDTDVVTEPCRLAFPALFEPKPTVKGGDDLKYQATLLLPPDMDLTPFKRAIIAAMEQKWGKPIQLKGRNNPLRKVDDLEEDNRAAGYEPGWRYINAKSNYQPTVLDQKKQEVLDPDRAYPGCWCRFHLTAYGWEHAASGKGVSFSLNAVQLVRDDEKLGGRRDARDVFGIVDTEDDPFGEGDDLTDPTSLLD